MQDELLGVGARARLLSVNVGTPREFTWLGRTERSAIWKLPVEGPVDMHGVNMAGDDQADRSVHGGPDKAVYAYSSEDEAWWEEQLGRPLGPAPFGENLTLEGVDVTDALIGERWQVGDALFEVCQPRVPCWKLGVKMGDAAFPPKFAAAGRPGAYLRIVHEAPVAAGDPLHIVYRPSHGVTVGDIAYIYHKDHSRAYIFLELPELAETWLPWARKMVAHRQR